jgi:hypothetical protein
MCHLIVIIVTLIWLSSLLRWFDCHNCYDLFVTSICVPHTCTFEALRRCLVTTSINVIRSDLLSSPLHICTFVRLARTMYTRCIYGIFGREITKYTVMYSAHIRFGPPYPTHLRWCLMQGFYDADPESRSLSMREMRKCFALTFLITQPHTCLPNMSARSLRSDPRSEFD